MLVLRQPTTIWQLIAEPILLIFVPSPDTIFLSRDESVENTLVPISSDEEDAVMTSPIL